MRCVKLDQLAEHVCSRMLPERCCMQLHAAQRLQAELTVPPRGTLGACKSMHIEQGLIAENRQVASAF